VRFPLIAAFISLSCTDARCGRRVKRVNPNTDEYLSHTAGHNGTTIKKLKKKERKGNAIKFI
jgi:hypothetical protein